jgi:hypothetical protein
MSKTNILKSLIILISFFLGHSTYIHAQQIQVIEDDPPVAVVIKTPPGKPIKRKPKPKVTVKKTAPVCPACPVCPECPPVCPAICCPIQDECALTIPEALSYKDDFNIFVAFALNKQRSFGRNAAGLDSWLTSPWSLGFTLGTEYYFTERFSIYANYSFTQMAFDDTQPGIILIQNNRTASKAILGAKYRFSKYFGALLNLGLKQDFTLYSSSLPYAIADDFWHGLAGLGLTYHIWHGKRIGFDGITGFDFYFPSTKVSYKANIGYALNTDLKVTFKYKPEFFISMRYEFFKLNLDNFTGQYGHLFTANFGINFRSKVLKSDFWNRN